MHRRKAIECDVMQSGTQVQKFCSTTLHIETAGSLGTSLPSYQNIRYHIPEYGNIKINSSEYGGDVILLKKVHFSLSTP